MGTVPVGGYLSSHTVAKSVWVWPSSGGMITPRVWARYGTTWTEPAMGTT